MYQFIVRLRLSSGFVRPVVVQHEGDSQAHAVAIAKQEVKQWCDTPVVLSVSGPVVVPSYVPNEPFGV